LVRRLFLVHIHLEYAMEDFDFEQDTLTISGFGRTIPILLVGPNRVEYFRANDVAGFLGYKQPAIAVTKHVREKHVKDLQKIVEEGVYDSYTPSRPNKNDLASRWITEPGLYQLVFKSHMTCAAAFQDYVFEKVLPSIRKTGSYSVQAAAPADKEGDNWHSKRLEGKELMKLKNASLQQLIAGGFGQTGLKLYGIVANHVNQAVLGLTQTTTQFKQQQQLPRHISIPDMLNMQGQVARCYAETCFHKFVTDNLQRLRGWSQRDLIEEFTDLKLNLRQGFVSTGMGDLKTKLLTIDEAKKRKADASTQRRKQQKLMQAEQPRAIECAAQTSHAKEHSLKS